MTQTYLSILLTMMIIVNAQVHGEILQVEEEGDEVEVEVEVAVEEEEEEEEGEGEEER